MKVFLVLTIFSSYLINYSQTKSKWYDGPIRPYDFGYSIEGHQHRHEEKNEKGEIMGEFGFVTGDGVYHSTGYATDEDGNFKILFMRNVHIGLPGEQITKTAGNILNAIQKPKQQQQQQQQQQQKQQILTQKPKVNLQSNEMQSLDASCSNCAIPEKKLIKKITVKGLLPASFVHPSDATPNKTLQKPKMVKKVFKLLSQTVNGAKTVGANQPNTIRLPVAQPNVNSFKDQSSAGQQGRENESSKPNSGRQNESNRPNDSSKPNSGRQNESSRPNGSSRPNSGRQNESNRPNDSSKPNSGRQNESNRPNGSSKPNSGRQNESNRPNESSRPNSARQNEPSRPNTGRQNESSRTNTGRQNESIKLNSGRQNEPIKPNSGRQNEPIKPNSGRQQVSSNKPNQLVGGFVESNQKINANQPQSKLPNQTPNRQQNNSNQKNDPQNRPAIDVRGSGITNPLHQGQGRLYRFNYTVGYHGHHEEGDYEGAKDGGYYFVGRDGIKRIVDYKANEFGYQPNIKLRPVDSPNETPNEQTEKEAGLKGYEFKWFNL